MRSILNSVSTTTLIILVVGGSVAVSVGAVFGARKVFPSLADGPFEELADALRVVYELVFALILAFVLASVLDTFATAESTVAAEATTLAHMKRASQALPIEQRVLLDRGLSQYVHAIVEDEWVTMREGKESFRASASLETLYALYQSYSPPPAAGSQAEFYGEAVDQLGRASTARRDRLQLSASDLPFMLRVFVPIGGVLLLALEFRPRMQLRPQLVHMALLATVVSFSYLLTIVLDYPFSGEVTVSSEPFTQGALAEYWSSNVPHVITGAEKEKDLSPSHLVGVWNSDAFGIIVFRQVDDRLRAVYRVGVGTVVGDVSPDGVFRGWWCDGPTRQPLDDAGEVEWRLARTPIGEVVYGSWRYGTEEALRGGWDLKKVGGPEPPDLAARLDAGLGFCAHP